MLRQGAHFLPLFLDRCTLPAGDPRLPPVILPRYPRSPDEGRPWSRVALPGSGNRPDLGMVRRHLGR